MHWRTRRDGRRPVMPNALTPEEQLLKKHSPILVLYPQDTTKARPGDVRAKPADVGDYHPCSAEFFLERALLRKKRPGYSILALFSIGWTSVDPDDIRMCCQ